MLKPLEEKILQLQAEFQNSIAAVAKGKVAQGLKGLGKGLKGDGGKGLGAPSLARPDAHWPRSSMNNHSKRRCPAAPFRDLCASATALGHTNLRGRSLT